MNIFNEYIKQQDDMAEHYAFCLLELYTYAVMGSIQSNDDKSKNKFEEDKKEYRKEILELIKKGKRE